MGQAGAFNFFMRCGFKVSTVGIKQLGTLTAHDLLVVDIPETWDAKQNNLAPYLEGAHDILFTGHAAPIAGLIDLKNAAFCPTHSPYNTLVACFGNEETPIQPAGWGAYAFDNSLEDLHSFGELFEVSGDRLSPTTALRNRVPSAYLFVEKELTDRRITFANGFLFSALQSWLQGETDLSPWLSWNSRQHWLDDFVDKVFQSVHDHSGHDFKAFRRNENIPPTTICFRHDNDDSTDDTFAQMESQQEIPATYALLDDENLADWKQIAAANPLHEYTLHYPTIAPKYQLGKFVGFAVSKTPFHGLLSKRITGADALGEGKLIRYVENAQSNGLETSTLHRHFSYLPYPEIVDAIDGVYASAQGVIATSSFFRGSVYRWGARHVDGELSTVGQWPDAQFPFWMPFKLAHSARRGKILDGWECTLLMESEPGFFEQITQTRHRHLPHKFMMFCYHPSNTKSSSIAEEGTLDYLRSCIEFGKNQGFHYSRYDDFITLLNTQLIGPEKS